MKKRLDDQSSGRFPIDEDALRDVQAILKSYTPS
jgi:hypothetical protein